MYFIRITVFDKTVRAPVDNVAKLFVENLLVTGCGTLRCHPANGN